MTEQQYRYADAPTTEVSRTIAATPDALWAHIADINLPARFSTEFQGAEWLDGATEPAVGARFRGTNEHPRVGRWQVEVVITDVEPGRVLGWEIPSDGGPAARWRFTLEPVAGGTLVTQWCQLGPGRSGLNPAIEKMPDREHDIVAGRLAEHRANMERNLVGLADLVAAG